MTSAWNRFFAKHRKKGMSPKAIGRLWRKEGKSKSRKKSRAGSTSTSCSKRLASESRKIREYRKLYGPLSSRLGSKAHRAHKAKLAAQREEMEQARMGDPGRRRRRHHKKRRDPKPRGRCASQLAAYRRTYGPLYSKVGGREHRAHHRRKAERARRARELSEMSRWSDPGSRKRRSKKRVQARFSSFHRTWKGERESHARRVRAARRGARHRKGR